MKEIESDKPNAEPLLRGLLLVTAVLLLVILALALREDHLPFERARMDYYLLLIAAFGGCCWVFGWLQGRRG